MSDVKPDISDRREAAGLSIYKLAKLAGIKWETLRDIERGSRKPKAETAYRINRALAECERQ